MDTKNQFGGVLLSAVMLDRLTVTQTAYAPASSLGEHGHSNPFFCFIGRGGFDETAGRETATFGAGELIFRAPGERHRDRFHASGATCLNIEVAPSLVSGMKRGRIAHAETLRIAARLHRAIRGMRANALVVEGLTLQLIGHASDIERSPSRGGWLKRVIERVRRDYASPLTVCALAEFAGVHPVHLARRFRREHGISVRGYIESVRLERARELLLKTEAPLAELAANAGFCDESHLIRTFKRATGMTPGRFRSAHR